ncbi:hypothetical protein [Enterococcus sp. BWR-S5]|uniref:hypothetical protein n=1 Tax=Enterococcus sp. BWR-S5 TaxID=2787714 RepID=UPI0019234DBB|nr:hypothetical protein [Enterococcus sp. BWR-S5]MBL1227266.1 hypothetical protein [Enterococcus sp. BWR-S5]
MNKKKFRGRSYLNSIKRERYSTLIDPDTYIYPQSAYTLSWIEFFAISHFPKNKQESIKETFKNHYIESNWGMIDVLGGKELDLQIFVSIDYFMLSFLKANFPICYTNFLLGYQYILLKKKYRMYPAIPKELRNRFATTLYNKTDSAVSEMNQFFEKDR